MAVDCIGRPRHVWSVWKTQWFTMGMAQYRVCKYCKLRQSRLTIDSDDE